jgi:hypothetical protein
MMRLPCVALLALVVLSSCKPPSAPPACRRYETLPLGPENGFRLAVAKDAFPLLDNANERIDVALSVVPPLVGPVTLVQIVDGQPLATWDLPLPPPTGLSTRCSIGLSLENSTCGATIRDRPHPPGGSYELQARGNTVLEASIAFFVCDEDQASGD